MRPHEIKIISVLTYLNAFRIVGFAFAVQALSGDLPKFEVFGGIGDGIAGLTAIIVATALLTKPAFVTWLAAIIWNVYALTDAFFANAINTFAPDAEPQSIGGYLFPLFFICTHIVNLRFLARPAVRKYYKV